MVLRDDVTDEENKEMASENRKVVRECHTTAITSPKKHA